MIFGFSRPFVQYIFLGAGGSDPFWSDSTWRSFIYLALEPVISQLGEGSVHARKVTGSNSRESKFAPVSFSPDASSTWNSEGGRIVDLQVFVPPRSQLIRKAVLPQVYVHIQRQVQDPSSAVLYDYFLHLVVGKKTAVRYEDELDSAVQCFLDAPSVIAGYSGESKVRSLNMFEDLLREKFMYLGMLDHPLPDLSKASMNWKPLPRREG